MNTLRVQANPANPSQGDSLNPSLKSLKLPSGVRLQYAEQGDPTGMPVILLHGGTDSWHSFEPVMPFLPRSLRVFAISQRGHGDSDRPESGYRFKDFSDDVLAFMNAMGIVKAMVVGHSMGSGVAQHFAIYHPDRTLGVVLMGAFASFDTVVVNEFYQAVIAPLTDPIEPAIAREFQESTLARPIPEAMLETFIRESLKVPARVWKEAFAGFLQDTTWKHLNQIVAPALIIWGDQDVFAPRSDQVVLNQAIQDSRLLVYEGAGHAMHWEEPGRVATDIMQFAQRLGSA